MADLKHLCLLVSKAGHQCTLPYNHAGEHHAYNNRNECVEVFTDIVPLIFVNQTEETAAKMREEIEKDWGRKIWSQ